MMRWKYTWMASVLWMGCAEYGLDESPKLSNGTMDASDYRRLRLDITPSNASEDILPQSFWIDESSDWQNLDLSLFCSPKRRTL